MTEIHSKIMINTGSHKVIVELLKCILQKRTLLAVKKLFESYFWQKNKVYSDTTLYDHL